MQAIDLRKPNNLSTTPEYSKAYTGHSLTFVIATLMGYKVSFYYNDPNGPNGISRKAYDLLYCDNDRIANGTSERDLWNGLDVQFMNRAVSDVIYPFEKDYNLLLPVIRRIEELGYVVAIRGISYQIHPILNENSPIISLVCGDLSRKHEMTLHLITEFINYLLFKKS